MGLTNFPNGLTSFGVPVLPGLPQVYTGNYWFVNESEGLDGNSGKSPEQAFATLGRALALAENNNNDVIFLEGTVHLSATLNWTLNQTHLIGICAPMKRGKRARISVTGTTAFTPLVNVTGAGCNFANFGTFYGFNSASNNAICWQDSGGRNSYNNVEFLGFGDGTATTGTANIAAARAFYMNGSTGETTFTSCVFGVDTTVRNGTNYTFEVAGGAPRCYFYDCDFEADIGSSGAASAHFYCAASSAIDRYWVMRSCRFHDTVNSGGTTMTQAFVLAASVGGYIVLDNCYIYGITKVETTATNQIFVNNPTVVATANEGIHNT